MRVWRDSLFVVFKNSVDVFPLPSFESSSTYHFGNQSLRLPSYGINSATEERRKRAGEAYIYEASQVLDGIVSSANRPSLRVSIRNHSGAQYILSIVQAQDGLFSWDAEFCKDPEFYDVRTYKHCVGTSTGYQLRLASDNGQACYPAALELTFHPCPSATVANAQIDIRKKFIISAPNLPILDLTTAMDFDDAAGVILLGSCRGEVSVIQFVSRSSMAPGSLLDNLPAVDLDLLDLQTVRSVSNRSSQLTDVD